MRKHEFVFDAAIGNIDFYNAGDTDTNDETLGLLNNGADEDERSRFTCVPFGVSFYPARRSYSIVTVEFHQAEPALDLSAWDHVTECPLALPSGGLEITCGWGGDYPAVHAHLETAPGHYRMRICHGNLGSAGDRDARDGGDFYRVVFWRSRKRKQIVLKQYAPYIF